MGNKVLATAGYLNVRVVVSHLNGRVVVKMQDTATGKVQSLEARCVTK